MQFSATLVSLALVAGTQAHMHMANPQPFASNLDNNPLDFAGANFPCKQTSAAGYARGTINTDLPSGGSSKLSFIGGANHGGGSCQISITYDEAPTANSVFKVIHSIEGGCPTTGSGETNQSEDPTFVSPDTYTFPVPSDLPTGKAILAWTWFNRVGDREMYMNCAPVTITGGSSKRDEAELQKRADAFDALPHMFVANIGVPQTGTACTVSDGDLAFPSPGVSAEKKGTAPLVQIGVRPSGQKTGLGETTPCQAGTPTFGPFPSGNGAPSGGSSSGGSSGGSSASAPSGSSPSAASGSGSGSGTGASSAIAGSYTQVSAAGPAASAGSPSGGAFLQSSANTAPTAAASPAASSPSAAVSPAAASPSAASPAAPAGTGSAPSGGSTAGAFAAGTACTTEGQWNCIGGSQFQQCASGMWSAPQGMSGGTTCTAGQSATLKMAVIAPPVKREPVFPRAHLARAFAAFVN